MTTTNDVLIVRDYHHDKDLERVQAIFRGGMAPLAPVLANRLTRHRLLTPGLQHPLILAILPCVIAMTVAVVQQSNHNYLLLLRDSSSIYGGSVVLGSLGYHLIHHVVARYLFHGYIQQSLTSDLANIPTTYQSNGGLFLVAVTHDTDHVLGMVAAEFKKEESNNTNVPVYELRRMSVDASVRGLGIGKKLLTVLEDRLPTPSKIILYTSNVQYSAHRLYERHGFRKQGVEVYGKWPLGFEIWYYVKDLLE